MRRTAIPGLLAVLLTAGTLTLGDDLADALARIRADAIRAHLYFLAHDRLEGRGPGTRGGELATLYIAAQMKRAGLEPVNGSYFQPVYLSARALEAASSQLSFTRAAATFTAEHPADAVYWSGRGRGETRVEGELVFVGHGVYAPEHRWDDFKGEDLDGKVLLVLVNDPPAPPEEPDLFDGRAMTYYGRWTYKLEEAQRRGAAGVLFLHTEESAGYPWQVVRSSWAREQLFLSQAPDEPDGVPLQGWIRHDFARPLLEAADLSLAQLHVEAARRDFRPLATGIQVRATLSSRVRALESANVLGLVRGSHPELRREVVIFTAHYDHLGIGPAVDGDSIYNGAYDNASGVAALLEIAAAFAGMDPTPRRSILFLATTAEEAGLLGAMHYVHDPPLPLEWTVANINLDGVNLWGETADVIALGGERSTLGNLLEGRAAELEVRVLRDPAPELGLYFRSDHFAFARAGVPAIAIEHGTEFRGRPQGWGRRLMERYHAQHYHQPSDRYDPGFDLSGAVQQARLAFLLGYDVAQAEGRPVWAGSDAAGVVPQRQRAGSGGRVRGP